FIDTCGNKAIELAECNGGLIADNFITNVEAGPQVIFGSRNIRICDNHVSFTGTGINVTEGSHHIVISGNIVEPAPSMNPKRWGACLIFRTEPLPLVTSISHVTVTGNLFRNQTTDAKLTLRFETRKESLGCTYEAIHLSGNTFDGDLQLHDRTTPARTTLKDILLADNLCEGRLINVPAEEMASRSVVVQDNLMRHPGPQILTASDWVWRGNTHPQGSLTITDTAHRAVVRGNLTAHPILNESTDAVVVENLVTPR
ncbi:MAG: hypothetical protein KDK99_15700, partial [Verrucomicrobiales bacterium]|nr:hypothetical protein [Verrucomicrobiales bacterium]